MEIKTNTGIKEINTELKVEEILLKRNLKYHSKKIGKGEEKE